MNKDNAKDFLPLVQALADGKTLQHRESDKSEWRDMIINVSFGGDRRYYRIKPEPVEVEVWYKKTEAGKELLYQTVSSEHASTYKWMTDQGWRKMKVREVLDE